MTLTVDLWPWKSIGFQILLRTKYVPSLVKIHWRMLILECSQSGTLLIFKVIGQRSRSSGQIFTHNILVNTLESTSFNRFWPNLVHTYSFGETLIKNKHVPSLVKIHWRILILECSQGCYAAKIWPLDLWPWKSIRFQTLLSLEPYWFSRS
jgi:hypothetical protein